MYLKDTITAISTPIATGAIGIIRISGPESLNILSRIYKSKNFNYKAPVSHHLYYGTLIDVKDESDVDSVLIAYMKGPSSYTGEDIIEINCHSGIVVLNKILNIILNCGARLAEPGEFTKRAFLNGRIDLTQAESVIDIIESKTETNLKVAAKHHQGILSDKLRKIKRDLIDLKSILETTIDFPEDENEIMSTDDLQLKCSSVIQAINSLISTYSEGVIYRTGIKAAIIGKPNVGKSSLLNSILQDDRAIVTSIPGTTRDIITETINVKGVPVNIIDTAGIGTTTDQIEKIGIHKTLSLIDNADILILVLDGSKELDTFDRSILEKLPDKKTIAAINKTDLSHALTEDNIGTVHGFCSIISISALYNRGIDQLKTAIHENIISSDYDLANDLLISNIRHKNLLEKTAGSLLMVKKALQELMPHELIAVDLQTSLNALGEITGETTTEDILDTIFSKFCIGK